MLFSKPNFTFIFFFAEEPVLFSDTEADLVFW